MNAADLVRRQPKGPQISIGIFLLLLVATADIFAGSELLDFPILYLLPVAFITWVLELSFGLLASTVCAGLVLYVNLTSPAYRVHRHVAWWNALIWLGLYCAFALILAKLKRHYLREKELSRTDPLTSIPNRLAFWEFTGHELQRAHRDRTPITIAYVDLDGFKQVNDALGHTTGDALLRTVASLVQRQIRQTDFAARIGGDEFVILFPNTNANSANIVLSKLTRRLERRMAQRRWQVTFSIGVVTYVSPPPSVDAIIRAADDLMYEAKASGGAAIRQRQVAA